MIVCRFDIGAYRTLVFDCDGVLLNSNMIKTEAFFISALPYGEENAKLLVDYHVHNGGISRYKKFEYLLRQILGKPNYNRSELAKLLRTYRGEVVNRLLLCEVEPGLEALREKTKASRWFVVSGGDQDELRYVFKKRGLDYLFDGGIFGSPDTKEQILERHIAAYTNQNLIDTVYLGDSQYDYEVAEKFGIDFIFVKGWSESKFSFDEAKCVVSRISDLI